MDCSSKYDKLIFKEYWRKFVLHIINLESEYVLPHRKCTITALQQLPSATHKELNENVLALVLDSTNYPLSEYDWTRCPSLTLVKPEPVCGVGACVRCASLCECVSLQSLSRVGRCLLHQRSKALCKRTLPFNEFTIKKKIGTLPGSTVLNENNIQS